MAAQGSEVGMDERDGGERGGEGWELSNASGVK